MLPIIYLRNLSSGSAQLCGDSGGDVDIYTASECEQVVSEQGVGVTAVPGGQRACPTRSGSARGRWQPAQCFLDW